MVVDLGEECQLGSIIEGKSGEFSGISGARKNSIPFLLIPNLLSYLISILSLLYNLRV
jgi:hypothetical protein